MFVSLYDVFLVLTKKPTPFGKAFQQAILINLWREAVGLHIYKNSYVLRISENILWIKVENNIWQQEIFLRKNQILKKINENPENTQLHIKDIFFVSHYRDKPKKKIWLVPPEKKHR